MGLFAALSEYRYPADPCMDGSIAVISLDPGRIYTSWCSAGF